MLNWFSNGSSMKAQPQIITVPNGRAVYPKQF